MADDRIPATAPNRATCATRQPSPSVPRTARPLTQALEPSQVEVAWKGSWAPPQRPSCHPKGMAGGPLDLARLAPKLVRQAQNAKHGVVEDIDILRLDSLGHQRLFALRLKLFEPTDA